MSDASTQRSHRRFWLAALGLVVMLAAPFAWALFLDNSFLRRTALPLWLMMVLGVALGVVASWQDRRTRTRVLACVNAGFLAVSIPLFGVFTRLPVQNATDLLPNVVPEFSLPNQLGETIWWTQISAGGYALLIFYRGHW